MGGSPSNFLFQIVGTFFKAGDTIDRIVGIRRNHMDAAGFDQALTQELGFSAVSSHDAIGIDLHQDAHFHQGFSAIGVFLKGSVALNMGKQRRKPSIQLFHGRIPQRLKIAAVAEFGQQNVSAHRKQLAFAQLFAEMVVIIVFPAQVQPDGKSLLPGSRRKLGKFFRYNLSPKAPPEKEYLDFTGMGEDAHLPAAKLLDQLAGEIVSARPHL